MSGWMSSTVASKLYAPAVTTSLIGVSESSFSIVCLSGSSCENFVLSFKMCSKM